MQTERGPFLSNPFVARAARWGLLAWSVIGMLVLAGVIYRYVLYPIRVIFPPLVVALIVIYLLNPLVTQLEGRGVRRVLGTLVVYVVVLSAVGVAIAYLSGVIAHQVTQFVGGIPGLLSRAQSALDSVSKRLGLQLDTKSIVHAFEKNGTAFNFFGRLTSFTSGVVHVAAILILGPLIAFYLLVDLPKIQRGAQALVPSSRREDVGELASKIGSTLGGFFRGQLLAALLMGLVSMLGYYVIGLPYFALLGALTGLFALVPLIGTVIAAIPTLFVALTTGHRTGGLIHVPGGWKLALATAIVLVLVQQLDSRLLRPRLLTRASRLNPVTVLLSLLVGGTLLGLWGMLLAVPVVASIKVTVLFVWDTRSQWPPRAQSSNAAAAVGPNVAATRSRDSPTPVPSKRVLNEARRKGPAQMEPVGSAEGAESAGPGVPENDREAEPPDEPREQTRAV